MSRMQEVRLPGAAREVDLANAGLGTTESGVLSLTDRLQRAANAVKSQKPVTEALREALAEIDQAFKLASEHRIGRSEQVHFKAVSADVGCLALQAGRPDEALGVLHRLKELKRKWTLEVAQGKEGYILITFSPGTTEDDAARAKEIVSRVLTDEYGADSFHFVPAIHLGTEDTGFLD